MFKVYVIKSLAHHRFYVGFSSDLARRIAEHNSGKTKSTKGYRPWMLLFSEEYPTRQEA
jgi:putative endonuclease